jgi:hypothetical protein
MPFDAADPRSSLAAEARAGVIVDERAGFAAAQAISFADHAPELSDAGSRSWRVRTQNFGVIYTDAVAGETFAREDDEFEYLVVLPDEHTKVHISCSDGDADLCGPALAVVPPGASTVQACTGGTLVRVYTAMASDLVEGSINTEDYHNAPPHVAVLEPNVPAKALQCYPLADYPADPARFGHIFRSQNLMLNFVPDRIGPRDITKLSPHSHSDFEQCTVQLQGRFVHHARTPWTPDSTTWRQDDHLALDGPGIAIFPPPIVHTSQAVGAGLNRLLDVFAPPRADFLGKPGWVLNADEYDDADGTA